MNDMHDVWAHPQLKARERWREVEHAGRARCRRCCRPACADSTARMDAVPALGEHTDAILAELGYASDDVHRCALRAT